jgi:hypothetical protein
MITCFTEVIASQLTICKEVGKGERTLESIQFCVEFLEEEVILVILLGKRLDIGSVDSVCPFQVSVSSFPISMLILLILQQLRRAALLSYVPFFLSAGETLVKANSLFLMAPSLSFL